MSNNEMRWYFGGLASAGAVCFTHPLDTLKVQMQMQKGKVTSMQLAKNVYRERGLYGFYYGISASVMRQLKYSTIRFAMYEQSKKIYAKKMRKPPNFLASVLMAGFGGAVGGLFGNPADLVNVRMQNDVRLPKENRRYYRNVLHGIYCVLNKEGLYNLWAGSAVTSTRAALMTIGQLAFYDKTKSFLLATPYFNDNLITCVIASLTAGGAATTLGQPMDVIKTRQQNAIPGTNRNMAHVAMELAKEGPLAFFKGFVPAFMRLAPQTVLTFVFLEQLTTHFGTPKKKKPKKKSCVPKRIKKEMNKKETQEE